MINNEMQNNARDLSQPDGDWNRHYLEVTGAKLHYVDEGKGMPIFLLHGWPEFWWTWHRNLTVLSKDFRVVVPDLRGFGDTDKPPAEEGYDSLTNARDMAALMTHLGHDSFHLHGEDRGAEFAYALAATERARVKTLSFAEMLLSGEGLEEWSTFTPANVSAQFDLRGVWVWHIPFFWIPHLPEMLITGREREFWEFWIKAETWNPNAITKEAIDEWIGCLSAPGGLRGCLETYRAGLKNARINADFGTDNFLRRFGNGCFGNLIASPFERPQPRPFAPPDPCVVH